ncbi:MAG: Ig-like domain-containing protein [Ruminococcus sp.]|nr:Ig-like domain-containing protein [Ruminococcus sp.]
MKKAKQVLSLILAASIIITVISVGIVSAGALKTDHSKYTPSAGVETYKYYFAMPSCWINTATCDNNNAAGCYWWDAVDNPNDVFSHGWPGYEMNKEEGFDNLYSINAPQVAASVVFSNYLDGGIDSSKPEFKEALQCKNSSAEFYKEGDSDNYSPEFWKYMWKLAQDKAGITEDNETFDKTFEAIMDDPSIVDFTPEFGENGKVFFSENLEYGLSMRFDGMIWIVDLDPNHITVINEDLIPGGKPVYDGEWYFMYGNGEYGMWPTKELALEQEGVTVDRNGKYVLPKGFTEDEYGTIRNKDGFVVVGNYTGKYYDKESVQQIESNYSHNKIYFEAPSFWTNYKDIRVYLDNMDTGEVMIPWNSKKGLMKDEGNGLWSFDLAAKGHTFNNNENYCCIFLTNTEMQTCELLINNPCLGDTAYCPGENDKVENAVDSNKKSYNVKWRKADPTKYAPPLTITSIGNVVGEALPKGQTKYGLFAAFLDRYAGAHGIDNAMKFNGKTAQQTIDDMAYTLGLNSEDVKKAIREKGRNDLGWDENKSYISKVVPASVKLNRGTLGLGVGESYGLVKTVSPSNASQTVSWSSSNTSVATVDSNGKVTGKKAGTAFIIAETYNGKAALCTVTVKSAPTSVKTNPEKLTLGKGESYTISENTNSGSYANAANLRWATTDSSIVSVTKTAGTNKAVLKANKAGTASIIITTYNNKIAVCNVTVKPAPTSVKTNPASLTLGKGESYTISENTNSGSYANAANLKWSSSNTNVATVTKGSGNKATVKAVGTGSANITIKLFNGKTATCKVTVKSAPSSVSTNPASLTLGNGESYTISENTNSGSYANAANLKWSSSNTNVATVTKGSGNKATVKAVGTGTANITIKLYNGKTATCKVTVKPAPSSVKLSTTSITLNKGKTYTISEITNSGSYANAANLKWTSTNANVATVTKGSGNKATIKAVNKGTAYVKITLYNGKTAQCKVTVK